MHKKRIINFIDLGCGAPQFDLTLKLSELGVALQALQDTIDGSKQPSQQSKRIRSAYLGPKGMIECAHDIDHSTGIGDPNLSHNLCSRELNERIYNSYDVIYSIPQLIRYLANQGDEIQDLKHLGIKKIWIQGNDIHIQGTKRIVDTIELNLHTMNTSDSAQLCRPSISFSIQPRYIPTGPCTLEGIKCLNNVFISALGVGSMASFTLAVIALAGLISLPMPVVGIAFAVCLALGASAAYTYYDTRARFNPPIEHTNLTRVGCSS